ncbi:unnamed protein product [Peniophora sp. CBMAI 1063]|nr:unnamed protein product [Peniophora sp. CBMAI 1063]
MAAPAPNTGPLDIHIENYVSGSSRAELEARLLQPNRARIRSITVASKGRSVAEELVNVIGGSPFPRLSTLSLECDSDSRSDSEDLGASGDEDEDVDEDEEMYSDPDDQPVVAAPLSIEAPALTEASLRNIYFLWGNTSFPQLKNLKIDITGSLQSEQRPSHTDIRGWLTGMHSLEHLYLGDMLPRYPGLTPEPPARIDIPASCRTVTLRVREHFWDSMSFILSLALPPTAVLNIILPCDYDTQLISRITSRGPRAVRIQGYDSIEGDRGCGTVSVMQNAATWLASPAAVLSSAMIPSTRIRFRIQAIGEDEFEASETRDEDVRSFAQSLRTINIGQTQVLHLQGFTSEFRESLLVGDEEFGTYEPLLLSAQNLEVLVVSGPFAYRASMLYDVLAGTGPVLCPRLHTLVVTEELWPEEHDSFEREISTAIENSLKARRNAGHALHTLMLPRSLENHALCVRIRESELVHLEFFDMLGGDLEEWDWQTWPPTT